MVSKKRIRVGVIFGGRSGEHEVSLLSSRSVLAALNPDKYQVTQIGITHDGVWLVGENVLDAMNKGNYDSLDQVTLMPDPTRKGFYKIHRTKDAESLEPFNQLDVVFPVLHGTFGEDGTIQGLFELADVAYVGAGVLGSSLGMDKGVFKDIMRAQGIPIVESLLFSRKEISQELDKVIEKAVSLATFPLFVKPANLGSSVGVTRCISRSDLIEGLFDAARFDRRVLVERGLNAREIEVSVLGNEEPQVSIPGEVIPSREFYSYEAKYIDDRSELLIPAPISSELSEKVREFAVQAYKAIDCAGMARVDFLLEKSSSGISTINDLYLSEVNTLPGFTQISMYPKLWEASGLSYPELIDRLIDLAMERKIDRDSTERRFTREM